MLLKISFIILHWCRRQENIRHERSDGGETEGHKRRRGRRERRSWGGIRGQWCRYSAPAFLRGRGPPAEAPSPLLKWEPALLISMWGSCNYMTSSNTHHKHTPSYVHETHAITSHTARVPVGGKKIISNFCLLNERKKKLRVALVTFSFSKRD